MTTARRAPPIEWDPAGIVAVLAVIVAPATLPAVLVAPLALRTRRLAVAACVVGVLGIVAHATMLGSDVMVDRVGGWWFGLFDAAFDVPRDAWLSTKTDTAGLAGYLSDGGVWRAAWAAQWPFGAVAAGVLAAIHVHRRPPVERTQPRWSLALDAVRLPSRPRRPTIGRVVESGNPPWEHGRSAVVPEHAWTTSGVIIGETGAGKTNSLLGLAAAAVHDGRKPYLLDMSGHPDLPRQFVAVMLDAGVHPDRIRVWPAEPYDAWRVDNPQDLVARLVGLLDQAAKKPDFFRKLEVAVTAMAVAPPGLAMPLSSTEFLARLRPERLKEMWRGTDEAEVIRGTRDDYLRGIQMQYQAVFKATGGTDDWVIEDDRANLGRTYVRGMSSGALDGDWSWPDCDAAIVQANALGNQMHAEAVGRLFLRDFGYHASTEPDPAGRLLICDEFSALNDPAAADLVERLRKFGCGVLLGTQTVDSRDPMWRRIIGAGGTVIAHRTQTPSDVVKLAGTVEASRAAWQVVDGQETGVGVSQERQRFRVDPNSVQRLPTGRAWVISRGLACQVQFDEADTDSRFAEAQRELAKRHAQQRPPSPSNTLDVA